MYQTVKVRVKGTCIEIVLILIQTSKHKSIEVKLHMEIKLFAYFDEEITKTHG